MKHIILMACALAGALTSVTQNLLSRREYYLHEVLLSNCKLYLEEVNPILIADTQADIIYYRKKWRKTYLVDLEIKDNTGLELRLVRLTIMVKNLYAGDIIVKDYKILH